MVCRLQDILRQSWLRLGDRQAASGGSLTGQPRGARPPAFLLQGGQSGRPETEWSTAGIAMKTLKTHSGTWTELAPIGTAPKRSVSPREWVFALYCEAPSNREDGQWYQLVLFRHVDRSLYGVKEWLSATLPPLGFFHDFAAEIIRDKALRKSLLSDDPTLPDLWKRHCLGKT